jgi:HK97 family phage portal protein
MRFFGINFGGKDLPPLIPNAKQAFAGDALSHKFSEAAPLIYLMFQGQTRGVWTKRNYAQYSDDAYKRCVVAYKCINIISRGAAKIPFRVKKGSDQDGKGGTDLPTSHPLVKLLARPNPLQSEGWFRESTMAYLLLSGNTYIEGVGPFKEDSPPLELWSLRPDRMKVVPGPRGPAGYTYEVNGQLKEWPFDPVDGKGPILHMKFFNPLDDWYGMSPVEAAAYSVDAHNMAGEWNQGLLQNGCRPSGALVYKPGESSPPNLSDKQKESLKEQLNSASAGTRNAGRPLILDGGLEWQAMSLTPAEMDWINGKNNSAREICMAFDVPPMMLGIPGDNTYANYKEARQALYQDTIIPLNDSILDGLNSWLSPLFGEDIKIVQDIENLPALSEVRKDRWTMVQTATWMTTNEKRAAVGMDELEGEEANEVLIPSTLVPLTGILDQPAPALGPDGLPLPVQEGEEAEGDDEEGEPEMGEDGKPLPPKKPVAKPGKPKPPFPPKAKTLDELFERVIAAAAAEKGKKK